MRVEPPEHVHDVLEGDLDGERLEARELEERDAADPEGDVGSRGGGDDFEGLEVWEADGLVGVAEDDGLAV